jgi:hypothetical protein
MRRTARSRRSFHIRRIWPALACGVALLVVAPWTGLVDVFGDRAIGRESVEQTVTSELMHQGVSASRVSCPADLAQEVGATMVCTYADALSEVVGAAILGEGRPRPSTGRVEVEVSGLRRRNLGRRASDVTSKPELSVRIIDRAR